MRPLQDTGYLSVVLSLLLFPGCGDNLQPVPSSPTEVPKFVYVTNNNPTSISAFAVDAATGALTSVPGSPFAAADSLTSIALHPNGKYLYTTGLGAYYGNGQWICPISGYSIDSNSGAVTAIEGSASTACYLGGSVTLHSVGNFLYETNVVQSHLFFSGAISTYSIDPSTGVLSLTTGATYFPSIASSLAQTEDRSGKFLYVTNADSNQVLGYTIDQTSGALAPIVGSPFPSSSPSAIAADPKHDFLFVTNANEGSVSVYLIDLAGTLSAVAGSPFTGAGTNPGSLAVDPTGTFLYVAHHNGVSGFRIGNSGGLTPIPGSPFLVGQLSSSIATDPSGKFVYVADSSSKQLLGMKIGTNGALTPIAGLPVGLSGDPPNEIVVLGTSP
jgi:6-phosphogluconolactonase (cycloisomerase 2 family)